MSALLRPAILILVLASVTPLSGCHSKFTRDRFEMITPGVDDREDVRKVLGKPATRFHDQWIYDDLDDHRSAVIHFDESGKVLAKEWMDARTGEWEGRNPAAAEPPPGGVRETRTRRIDDD